MLFLIAILKSQRDLREKLKRKRDQRIKQLEKEQAAEKEDFERKVRTCNFVSTGFLQHSKRLCERFDIIQQEAVHSLNSWRL